MNVIILSGFLGAGKTSFLLQFARFLMEKNGHNNLQSNSDAKLVIVENEVGKVSVDSETLGGFNLEYRELVSGCVCCSIAGEYEESLQEIEREMNPEWIIVEATGLAYPDRLIDSTKKAARNLNRLRVLVLVDAARFLTLQKVSPIIAGQIQFADFILLNKIDLVDDEKRAEVQQCLKELNQKAEIIELVATSSIKKETMIALTQFDN